MTRMIKPWPLGRGLQGGTAAFEVALLVKPPVQQAARAGGMLLSRASGTVKLLGPSLAASGHHLTSRTLDPVFPKPSTKFWPNSDGAGRGLQG
jgi:hypothetical protein